MEKRRPRGRRGLPGTGRGRAFARNAPSGSLEF